MDEVFDFDIKQVVEKLDAALKNLSKELSKIKTRISADLLDTVSVEMYGSKTIISSLASVTVRGSELLLQPWDKGSISPIQKGIQASGLGLNPIVDGNGIRVPVPPLSEERRKELSTVVSKKLEDSKVSIRNIRRKFIDYLKASEKNKLISQDDCKRFSKDVEKEVEQFTNKAISICKQKSEDIIKG